MIHRPYLWIMGLFFLMAYGCAINQSDEIQNYRRVIDGDRQIHVKSFEPGESLTLERALELAVAGNEQLAIAGEDYLQALIDKDRAFANFLPIIRFAPAYMRQEKSSIGAGNPLVGSLLPDKTLDLPVQGSLEIDPFNDVPVMQSTEQEAQRKRFLLLDYKAVILLDTAQTFYQILQSESRADMLMYSVMVGRKQLRDITIQETAGTATSVDISRAAAQLAAAQNDLSNANNDVSKGRALLAMMIGVPAVDGPLVDTFEALSPDLRIETLMEIADRRRQDLQAAHSRVQEAADQLQSAWAGYYPSVSLNLSYFFSRESFPDDVNWTSLIQANVPIFTAGLTHADVRTAYSRLRQAKLAESQTARRVAKDLRVALDDFTNDSRQICRYRIQAKAAAESSEKADDAFRAGVGTDLERMLARDLSLKSDLALTDAAFKRNIDYLRLLRAQGMLDSDIGITCAGVLSPEATGKGKSIRVPAPETVLPVEDLSENNGRLDNTVQ